MSITITDPALLAQLKAASGVVELMDPNGCVVATAYPENYGDLPPGVVSPVSDEEFEELRKEPDDERTLAEIIQDLEEKHGMQ